MTSVVEGLVDTNATVHGVRLGLLILISLLVAMLEGFDIQTIAIAAPVLAPELGLNAVEVGQIFSIGQAGLVCGALLGGILSDRFGRRNALIAGLITFGLFSILTAQTNSYAWLAVTRFLTGIGIGLSIPNLISVMVESAPPKHRAKTVATTLAGISVGAMVVALIGSAYISTIGWRGLFYIGGISPLVVAPLTLFLPNVRALGSGKADAAAGWRGALFGHQTTITVLLWISLFMTAATVYMMINWLPSLMKAQGFALYLAHNSSAAFSLGGCLGSISIGILVDRFGYARVVPPAYIGVFAGIGTILSVSDPWLIILGAGVLGFFAAGSFFTLNGLAARYYPLRARGIGTGASVAVGRLGSIFGPLCGGYVLQSGLIFLAPGPSTVPLAALPLVVAAAISVLLLTRNARLQEENSDLYQH
jgi:AAHS family 3-hydroxyphenylpropionic acid transporter